ncbi:hypothetical protein [Leptospira yasudae]|uniref:Uncharacterized protein n=1 Tax=Leptospira yasudae TaxID=2202201 RepID=A0A6N4QIF1_9LEPT|nr:hypothetical protein [Leptospira yasudae]TGL80873.1 hypothetical protein EHQ72_06590 [Leptospira yasudae]TGL81673.1 hypothetical protein EHQ77_06240 [Leptospira yasudae]TGL88049.1 hypothetical protein EHQ83_03600 [Leptospira yasudae]
MSMQASKKGTRSSENKIYISEKAKTIAFSAGFMRVNNLNSDTAKYVRLGYDDTIKKIGIEFSDKSSVKDESLKLTYAGTGSSASVPIGSLLSSFSLKLKDISGNYENSAIEGPQRIDGFTKRGFLISIGKRTN